MSIHPNTKVLSETTHKSMTTLVEGLDTVNAKIRKLHSEGFATADIARFLDTRYQRVRNCLVTVLKKT